MGRPRAHGGTDDADTKSLLLDGRSSTGQSVSRPISVTASEASAVSSTRTTTATSSIGSAFDAVATSTGDAADGFGPRVRYLLADDTQTTPVVLGAVGAIRDGADNTGNVVIQVSTAGSLATKVTVDESGNTTAVGSVKSTSPSGGVGYETGAGSTVAQGSGSGKATAVEINAICGQITMNNATLNAGNEATFAVTNSACATTDCIIVNHDSVGTGGAYIATAHTIGAGTFSITVTNVSGSNLGEAIVLNFAIVKAVAA